MQATEVAEFRRDGVGQAVQAKVQRLQAAEVAEFGRNRAGQAMGDREPVLEPATKLKAHYSA